MKLYDGGKAPNPRRVRIFLAEKGLPLPTIVPVDLGKGENNGPAFAAKNPWQRVPVLELDDGTLISESVAICRYFEELHPEPALFGRGARQRAEVEMWHRRLELGVYLAEQAVFRHLHPAMAQAEVPQIAAWGEANKAKVDAEWRKINDALKGRPFITGEAFSIADILGGLAVDFLRWAKLSVPADCTEVTRWHAALTARPSWTA